MIGHLSPGRRMGFAINPIMTYTATFRNGHCARRRVSEANRTEGPALRPEIDRSLRNILSCVANMKTTGRAG